MHPRALVLFSGGQDSTTCLAWALARFAHVETVGFQYGEPQALELAQRLRVLDHLRDAFPEWSARLGQDHLQPLAELAAAPGGAVPQPGRNLLFLYYAAAIAARRDLHWLVGGMCEADGSDRPDCRDDSIKAMQVALALGLQRVVIATPLMWRDKAETWELAHELGGGPLVEIVRNHTHGCYGARRVENDWGAGCGDCPACALRADGWQRWRERFHHRSAPRP